MQVLSNMPKKGLTNNQLIICHLRIYPYHCWSLISHQWHFILCQHFLDSTSSCYSKRCLRLIEYKPSVSSPLKPSTPTVGHHWPCRLLYYIYIFPTLAPFIHRPTILGPCLLHSIRLWDLVKFSAGLVSPHLPLLHFLKCLLLSPLGFDALRSSHDILLWEHYRYLQLHHFIQQLLQSQPTPYALTPFGSLCRAQPHSPGLI